MNIKIVRGILFLIFFELSACSVFASECPNDNDAGKILDYLKLQKNDTQSSAPIIADCVISFLPNKEPESYDFQTIRLINEIADIQEIAAKKLTSSNFAYDGYLRKAFQARILLVSYIENNSEMVGQKQNGPAGALRKIAENNLLSLASLAEQLKEGKIFSELIGGKITLSQTLTSQLFFDYGRSVSSCEIWDFSEGTKRDDKTTKRIFCNPPCERYIKTYFRQLDAWLKLKDNKLNPGHKDFIDSIKKRMQCSKS